jgi:hypothetical protein
MFSWGSVNVVAIGFRMATYPLEVPVNDVAGVEVAEAFSDVG